MKYIIKTFGILSIMAVVPAAMAATSRVSYNALKASNRLSVLSGISGKYTTAVQTAATSSTAALLDNTECIDNYTACIKGADVCGSDMEECTTNVLFHAKMPNCLSVLGQCKTSGVEQLFGTSSIAALSQVKEYDSTYKDEVKRYTYPTDGSVLGQMIIGAEITNRLTTEQCVRKYTNCLKKDTVCGDQFELCTEPKEFKKQALFCDSTLARCQGEGKTQLFGSVTNANNLKPGTNSRIGVAIKEGAETAAANAVLTCQKVADACFTNACSANPWRCIEDTQLAKVTTADLAAGGETTTTVGLTLPDGDNRNANLYKLTGIEVRKYFKSMCLETIGSNKYCYMTFEEKTPRDKDLVDVDNQEDVFSLAYAARKDAINTKLQDIAKTFDKNAKDKCVNTIKQCAMRSCGGGLGSVCYSEVFGNGNKTINNGTPYEDIKLGCAAVVNTDANCQYAATAADDGYTYNYVNKDTFDILFPDGSASTTDPIGVVASLNALLATSYNDAAIANMKKQCQTVAVSCVRSLCGADYVNCYRNRTDIVDGSYSTGTGLDKSMNKMGGILDYNIVMGLCMNTVKNANVCDEHLKIATSTIRRRGSVDTQSWGNGNGGQYGSVREAWLGANTTEATGDPTDVIVGCQISEAEAKSKPDLCVQYTEMPDNDGTCNGVMDEDGCLYTEPVTQSFTEYALTNGAKSLFQEVLRDIEKEVQAKYNAKITKEQNVCLAYNNGGIKAQGENGSTYMWVKLKSHKIPKNYESMGLKPSAFIASNDLYGSFCRTRVSVKSDDKDIPEALAKSGESNAYFAVGDVFTCGSWISSKTLEKITKKVGERAMVDEGVMVRDGNGGLKNSAKTNAALAWSTVGGFLGGGTLGYFVSDSLQRKGKSLGGLFQEGLGKTEDQKAAANKCLSLITDAENYADRIVGLNNSHNNDAYDMYAKARSVANDAKRYAAKAGVSVSDIDFGTINYTAYTAAQTGLYKIDPAHLDYLKAVADSLPCGGAYAENFSGNNDDENCYREVKGVIKQIDALATGTTQSTGTESIIKTLRSINSRYNLGEDLDALESQSSTLIREARTGSSSTEITSSDVKKFKDGLEDLQDKCQKVVDDNGDETARRNANLIAGAVTSVVGGALGGGIAKTIIDIKKEEIENEAVKEWMNEIGDHIECYVGTEFMGSYGDPVLLEIN